MMTRFAALLLALLVSGQAAFAGGSERVCRYTGRRVAPCAACPGKKQMQDARLLAQDCCELRQGHPLDVGARLPAVDAQIQVHWVELPEGIDWAAPSPPEQPGLRLRSGHDPPPRERLFLSLRQLLI
ncbi:hypothetical protein [Cystobacter fuscus]|uniref:hypothetical protein n=1 Tax=Cystobacter fuscus TaxID=43 RepID=UPI002B315961|nr:hypothetical protein F0U63_27880 [Cystobacter fuscus]